MQGEVELSHSRDPLRWEEKTPQRGSVSSVLTGECRSTEGSEDNTRHEESSLGSGSRVMVRWPQTGHRKRSMPVSC